MIIESSNKRIRTLINDLNISQTEFCKKTGIKESALSNYLYGNRSARQDQLSKIAETFNVNPAWLMGYDVEKEWNRSPRETPPSSEAERVFYAIQNDTALFESVKMLNSIPREQQVVVFSLIKTLFEEHKKEKDGDLTA